METQLLRLDKPYNIICNYRGTFALHIATLIVVKEEQLIDEKTKDAKTVTVARSYPVVKYYGHEGEVWMEWEVKDCMPVCRQEEPAGLYTLKHAIEYVGRHGLMADYQRRIPSSFTVASLLFGFSIKLPTDNSSITIRDYKVCLEFSEGNNGKTCMVYAGKYSQFYFNEYFTNEPDDLAYTPTYIDALGHLAETRDGYLMALRAEGLRSITFTTENTKYQWFVDKLNSIKTDGQRV